VNSVYYHTANILGVVSKTYCYRNTRAPYTPLKYGCVASDFIIGDATHNVIRSQRIDHSQ